MIQDYVILEEYEGTVYREKIVETVVPDIEFELGYRGPPIKREVIKVPYEAVIQVVATPKEVKRKEEENEFVRRFGEKGTFYRRNLYSLDN